ncbi:MAG: hypothetical protein E6J70_02260 [Deltaproteobacteria bacterium]|nr:MAG: hypothetical protein E6J70_02260 [Deltaproteobacteria bacterium]
MSRDAGRSAFLVLVALACACTHTVSAHHSGSVSKDRVAIVTTRTWRHGLAPLVPAHGWVTGVDGRPCRADTVEVLPGMHTFIVQRDPQRAAGRGSQLPCAVTFNAQPGHRYRVHYAVVAGTPRATIDDDRAGPLPVLCTVLRPPPVLAGPELR